MNVSHTAISRMISALICLLIFTATAFAQTGSVTGRVVDSEGEGICRASILASRAHRAISVIEESGRFTLEDLPAGLDTLTVGLIGYFTKTLPIEIIPGYTIDVEIVLDEAPITHEGASRMHPTPGEIAKHNADDSKPTQTGSVKGRVLDANGKGIVGAEILDRQIMSGTISDTSGWFLIQRLPVGPRTLRVTSVGFKPETVAVVVRSDSTVGCEVTLDVDSTQKPKTYRRIDEGMPMLDLRPKTGSVKGRISNGICDGHMEAMIFSLPAKQHVFSDENGNYLFKALPVGRDTLVVRSLDYKDQRIVVDVIRDSVVTQNIELEFDEEFMSQGIPYVVDVSNFKPLPGGLVGAITDDSNRNPVANAKVLLEKAFPNPAVRKLHFEDTVKCDAAGRFRMEKLYYGTRLVKVFADGYYPGLAMAIVIPDSVVVCNVTLTPIKPKDIQSANKIGGITGRIYPAKSPKTFPGVVVRVVGEAQSVSTDSNGTFYLTGIAAGDHEVEMTAPGYELRRRTVTVVGGNIVDVGNVVMCGKTGSVKGRVVDANGDGIFASVKAVRSADKRAFCDEEGKFTIVGLPAGPETLSISSDGYRQQIMPIVINSDSTIDINVVLREVYTGNEPGLSRPPKKDTNQGNGTKVKSAQSAQTGSVKGRVVDENGDGIIGALIYEPHSKHGAACDNSGVFRFPGIPVGPETLIVSSVGYIQQKLPIVIFPDSAITLKVKLLPDSHFVDFGIYDTLFGRPPVIVDSIRKDSSNKK